MFRFFAFSMAFLLCSAVYLFWYAKGWSYMTNDPSACANCHVMQQTYDSWKKSDHHHVAVCNDCHVPHNPAAKWAVKALNGMHHSYAFTFKELPSVLRAASLSKQIVEANCKSCHAEFVHRSTGTALNYANSSYNTCTHCHREVGHEHH